MTRDPASAGFELRAFDGSLERHAAELAARLEINCVIDVGANQGQWARSLRRAGYRGRIVSFEPIRASFERLRETAAGDPDWTVHHAALGDREGSLTLLRTANSLLASALPASRFAEAKFPDEYAVAAQETTAARRLDAVFPDLVAGLARPRVFLKLDTQGFDLRVFEGARGVLPWIFALQSELAVLQLYQGAPGYLDALSIFSAQGFVPTGFFPIWRIGPSLALCEFDCVLARDPHHSPPSAVPLAATAAAAGAPRLSVVVTGCVDSPALRSCLARTREQSAALGGEVLLVVNAAPEALAAGTRGELEKLCDRLLFEPRVGKSHALNTAVDASRGEVVAFTDDDAEPQPGWLAAISAPLLAADRPANLAGCGGPVLPLFPENGPEWFRQMVEEKGTHFLGPRHDLGAAPRDYLLDKEARTGIPIGANCAYRREVFAFYRYDPRLGPNRETGLRGGEDTLLAMMLMRDGFRLLYCPEARVAHPVHLDRMRFEHVRRGYFLHGLEFVRTRHLLGMPLPPSAYFERKLRGLLGKLWVARLQLALRGGAEREERWMRRLFKVQRLRGTLAELRSPLAPSSGNSTER